MANLSFDPLPLNEFRKWYQAAVESQVFEPDAMALATCTSTGIPSVRMVLYKGISDRGIRFFTHYTSRKGRELESNPRAAVVFYWASLGRQIRVEGAVEKLSSAETDAYWVTRPLESQINSAASHQSAPLQNREELESQVAELKKTYLGKKAIPRPPSWGGFCLVPEKFEFWTADIFRLHHRFCYEKKQKGWHSFQVYP